ncbi:CRCB-domain-containing protein [Metschnikowia bicuspidata var. bicuspidata NRRL YB-4993]|uniref:CRCB-domain-containing protein n=1 Tax=Metschnikowia bicuspidata var. bicuspidata NRRL YB-4993 TaxID=869754 RepID=A0A1A0HA37_9ASCO|nr:CRCB-domain-containing protein [Metschnikowia bicuspidata var. bicuspidata NRRL YB-4993]OBA20994.1 CRCB-domain-containing protein [Metschnikowia bicuspidata var. bicuspidata NRRL YB-4993]
MRIFPARSLPETVPDLYTAIWLCILSRHRQFHGHLRRASNQRQELDAESYGDALPEDINTYSASHEKHVPVSREPPHMAYTYLAIMLGSICGVLARKGLELLTTYDGSYLEGVVWANFVSCISMGMVAESEKIWARLLDGTAHLALYVSKAAVPLYVGIATGFCGSCSSFSSLILEAFGMAANLPPNSASYPTEGYGILGVIQVLVAQLTVSVGGFRVGSHITLGIEKSGCSFSPRAYRKAEILCAGLAVAMYTVVVVLVATKNDGQWRSWTFACLFAPWGAFLRFWLSRFLNLRVKNFPVGTFVANLGGTVLLAILTLLARGRSGRFSPVPIVSSVLNCHVLSGLGDGFCGCLTTVSTFIVELCALGKFHGYVYGMVSIWASFVAMLLVVGSYNWTVGLVSPVC